MALDDIYDGLTDFDVFLQRVRCLPVSDFVSKFSHCWKSGASLVEQSSSTRLICGRMVRGLVMVHARKDPGSPKQVPRAFLALIPIAFEM